MSKGDPGVKQSQKRVAFARRHASKTFQQWQSYCQGCGDLKGFTWYPRELQPQFKRLRASWTYMTKAEKKKPDFQRPKKWFPKYVLAQARFFSTSRIYLRSGATYHIALDELGKRHLALQDDGLGFKK